VYSELPVTTLVRPPLATPHIFPSRNQKVPPSRSNQNRWTGDPLPFFGTRILHRRAPSATCDGSAHATILCREVSEAHIREHGARETRSEETSGSAISWRAHPLETDCGVRRERPKRNSVPGQQSECRLRFARSRQS